MELNNDEPLRKGHRLAVIICSFMIASVFVYAGVVEYLAAMNAPFHGFSLMPAAVYDKLRLILLGLALVDFALIPYMRNRALAGSRRPGTTSTGNLPEPVMRLITASMISFALCESIAIYGLVLFLLIALAAFAIHFPRYARWQEWLQGMPEASHE